VRAGDFYFDITYPPPEMKPRKKNFVSQETAEEINFIVLRSFSTFANIFDATLVRDIQM